MPETAQDAVRFAQGQLDPTAGGLFPDDFVLGYVENAQRSVRNEIVTREVTIGEYVVTLPGVAAYTTDLTAFQAAGGPLANLEEPMTLREKQAGSTPESFTEVRRVDELPPRSPDTLLGDYEWTAGQIRFLGATQALDLEVRFEGSWPALQALTDPLPAPGLAPVLGWWAAALIADALGQAQEAAARLGEAKHQLAKWTAQRVLASQRVTRRPRPFREPAYRGWGGVEF